MRRIVPAGRLRRRLAITFALVAAIATGALALGTYLVVRDSRLDDSVDSALAHARTNLVLAGTILRGSARGRHRPGRVLRRRSDFETVALAGGEAFSSSFSFGTAQIPAGVQRLVRNGDLAFERVPDRRRAVPRRGRTGPTVADGALLLLLRRGPARRSRAAADDSPGGLGRRGRPLGGRRRARRPARSPPGRAGERGRPLPRGGAARDPASGRCRRRVRRLGGVVQRDGRGARGEDPCPLGGAGARAALHLGRRARAAHAADGARRRGLAARRAPRAHAGGGAAAGSDARRGRRAGCAAWSRS